MRKSVTAFVSTKWAKVQPPLGDFKRYVVEEFKAWLVMVGIATAFLTVVLGIIYGIIFLEKTFGPRKPVPENPSIVVTQLPQPSAEQARLAQYVLDKNFHMYDGLALDIAEGVLIASSKTGVPAPLLIAIMDIESDYKFDVASDTSIGLMGVNYEVWRAELIEKDIITGARDLYIPQKNILAGAYIYRKYYEEGKQRKEKNPHAFASQRYLNNKPNNYYQKMIKALGEYYLWNTAEEPLPEIKLGFHLQGVKRKGVV